ncbi:MAG: hypothetical protein HFJ20_07835 [Clostridia bacterium]|nr:hypothetical protein [Clostridia bacterium]
MCGFESHYLHQICYYVHNNIQRNPSVNLRGSFCSIYFCETNTSAYLEGVENFNSLKLAIDTMFALNETSERKTVKMCKHCGKPFASDNLKAEYCSPQCRNQANVYKSRAKNK